MDGPGYTIDLAYDGEGRRVKKVSADGATIFVYDASGVLIAEYSGEVAAEPRVSYLTTDHLGSPRVVTDERGSVRSRRDFTAFGEESFTAQRTQGLGYQPTEVRKDYTGYEKDEESGLEFAQARYYNATHGRFTSVDPLTASATIRNPQTLNRYSYALNSPYKFTDPLGLLSQYTTGACGGSCPNSDPNNSGGGWVGSSYGMSGDWVATVVERSVSKSIHTHEAAHAAALRATAHEVEVTEVTNYYEVSGRDADDALRNSERSNSAFGRAGGTKLENTVTEVPIFKMDNSFDAQTGIYSFEAEITDVTVTATITTTLPTWKERESKSPEEQAKWDGYLSQLKGFEAEHTKDTKIRLNEYRDALIGLRALGAGNSPKAAETAAASSMSAQITSAKNTLFTNYNADGNRRDANGGHTIHVH